MVAGTVAFHSKPHFPEFSLLYDYRLNLDRRGICLLFGSLKGKVAEKSVKVKVTQCIQLLVTPWTVTCQAALSMEFCRREHHFFLPGILPPQGSTLGLLHCRGDSLPSEPPGSQEGHWRLPWLNRVTRVGEDGGTGGDNAAYPCSLYFISGSSQSTMLLINPGRTPAAWQKTGRVGSHTEAEVPVHPFLNGNPLSCGAVWGSLMQTAGVNVFPFLENFSCAYCLLFENSCCICLDQFYVCFQQEGSKYLLTLS